MSPLVMKHAFRRRLPRVALLLAALCGLAHAQTTPAQWKADLDHLAGEFPRRHKNAFAVLSKEAFAERVAAITKRLPALDERASEGQLVELIAAVGDSHSAVEMRALAAGPRLPLGLWRYPDGFRLVAVPKAHEQAAGGILKSIGTCDVAELTKRLRRVTAFDNEASTWNGVANLATIPRLLEYLGVVSDAGRVPLVVVDESGKETPITVTPGPIGRDPVVLRPKTPPITAHRGKWHDHEWLEKEGILYVQYNKCASDAENDLATFTEGLVAICAKGKVKALVVDVQHNGGGVSPLGDEMFAKLAKEAPMKDGKNVFCVVGRRTFSSAILNAMTLKSRYRAVLVGEPTGGSPNHFGEVTSFELPNSKLKVFYSKKYFERAPRGTKTIEPDHLVTPTFADYLAGRDVVLETIRKLMR